MAASMRPDVLQLVAEETNEALVVYLRAKGENLNTRIVFEEGTLEQTILQYRSLEHREELASMVRGNFGQREKFKWKRMAQGAGAMSLGYGYVSWNRGKQRALDASWLQNWAMEGADIPANPLAARAAGIVENAKRNRALSESLLRSGNIEKIEGILYVRGRGDIRVPLIAVQEERDRLIAEAARSVIMEDQESPIGGGNKSFLDAMTQRLDRQIPKIVDGIAETPKLTLPDYLGLDQRMIQRFQDLVIEEAREDPFILVYDWNDSESLFRVSQLVNREARGIITRGRRVFPSDPAKDAKCLKETRGPRWEETAEGGWKALVAGAIIGIIYRTFETPDLNQWFVALPTEIHPFNRAGEIRPTKEFLGNLERMLKVQAETAKESCGGKNQTPCEIRVILPYGLVAAVENLQKN